MVRIRLQPSRILLVITITMHLLAALAPWFSRLPAWCSLLLLLPLGISLRHQVLRICQRTPDSVVGLVLCGEECRPVYRNAAEGSEEGEQLAPRVYCAPLLQMIYFRRAASSIFSRIFERRRAVLVMPDSCSPDEQRVLRRFLRWRCS